MDVYIFKAARVKSRIPIRNHSQLLIGAWVVDGDLQHEAVQLGLRQRICSFIFDRVLCRQNGEERRQLVRFAVDGHLTLFHRFEQRGLSFGRRAIDLIGQQQVGEDRPMAQRERRSRHVENVCAGDVGRHQIGGELYPPEVRANS